MNLGVVKQNDYAGNDEGNGDKNPQQGALICVFHLLILPKMLCIHPEKPFETTATARDPS